jgi:flagellar M-ring protein FliF
LNPLSSYFALSRLRGSWVGTRRFVLAQPPMIRAFFALTVLAGFGSIVYLAGQPFSLTAKPYLASGRSFNSDELNRIRHAFEGRLAFGIDAQRRVQVSADQFDTASALLAKLGLGIRSVEELRNESLAPNFFESDLDKQRRVQLGQEKILETLIDSIPEITWSYVKINQSRPTVGLRPIPKVSAFVSVETRDDAKLSYRTVEMIKQIIVNNVNELAPNAVTLMDRKARTYLDAKNTVLQTTSRDRAREEELRQDIFEKLDWIKGIRISVHVEPPPGLEVSEPPAVESVAKATPKSVEPHWARKKSKRSSAGKTAPPSQTLVAANTPVDLDSVAPGSEESELTVDRPIIPTSPPARHEPRPRGRIGIEVPRSFYYHNYMIATSGERKPSPDAIKPSIQQIESKIRESVKMVVPGPRDAWEIRIDMIPDDIPLVQSAEAAQAPETRRKAVGWEVIGAVVALAVVVSVSAMVRYGRRPEPRGSFTSGSQRFHRDSPGSPAPSERVRELVRRNPQAAASVLQRWIGQGGDAV